MLSDELLPANGAFIGLAPPGEVGSWQTESKVSLGNCIFAPYKYDIYSSNELMVKSIFLIYRDISSGQKQKQMVVLP